MVGPAPDHDLRHSQWLSRCGAAAMAEWPAGSRPVHTRHQTPASPRAARSACSRAAISAALSRVRGPSPMRLRSRARGCSAMAQHSRSKRSRAGISTRRAGAAAPLAGEGHHQQGGEPRFGERIGLNHHHRPHLAHLGPLIGVEAGHPHFTAAYQCHHGSAEVALAGASAPARASFSASRKSAAISRASAQAPASLAKASAASLRAACARSCRR